MILLIEPFKKRRKRLCDLLSRERIIGVDSITETLEMVCKFKNSFDILVANIHLLYEILSRETLFRLCDKLYIEVPPVLGLYTKDDEEIRDEFEKKYSQYKLLEYDDADDNFPERYIQTVRELFPDVMADVNKATQAWLKREETKDPTETREWLELEGFIEPRKKPERKEDYEKMYLELKKRYDEILSHVKKLSEFIEPE
jgi:hypothetical protein